jgi:hypothetical protein
MKGPILTATNLLVLLQLLKPLFVEVKHKLSHVCHVFNDEGIFGVGFVNGALCWLPLIRQEMQLQRALRQLVERRR